MLSQIEKTIKENQHEFMDMVIKFVNEKLNQKQTKAPKTICHFQALGKTYDSNVFTRNYEQFLLDVSKILSYDEFKAHMHRYVRLNENEFSKSTLDKVFLIKLHNRGIVSTHSSTEKKLTHIKRLCEYMGINLTIL